MAVTGRADGERAQRKRKRSGDDGDTVVSCDAKLLKALEKIKYLDKSQYVLRPDFINTLRMLIN